MESRNYKRNHYSDDYKREVVQKFLDSGLPETVFATSVGIDHSMLHRWRRKFIDESISVENQIVKPEYISDEMIAVKREIVLIKKKMEILQNVIKKTLSDRYMKELSEINTD
ncbi:MAG TPA: transposase [Chitinispirillaceae bacterium]|nr:transposase [Chitinispirillaceae bacterium]